MNPSKNRAIYWAPRILCILYALFLSLFGLDVFGEGTSFWETVLALLMHLVPVYIVVIVLILAWRWEWVGALVFLALAAIYVIVGWGKFHWSAYLAIVCPLALVGALFWINWINRAKLRTR